MSIRFGVYIGNSSCCIAVNKGGKVDVVANAAGDRVTPVVVAYHKDEIVTGLSARHGLIRHNQVTVYNILRIIGSTEKENLGFSHCPLVWGAGGLAFSIDCNGKKKEITPVDVLVHIFSQLKGTASSHSSGTDFPVVITLPIWVHSKAYCAIEQAAREAGFRVLSIITQPAASCIAYGLLDNNRDTSYCITVHCGGSLTTASLVEVSGGLLTVKDTTTPPLDKAGDYITELLVDHFANEFYLKYKGDPLENRRSRQKLFTAAESCKHILSTLGSAQINVESLWEGVDFSSNLSRARFEGIIGSTFVNFLVPVQDLLSKNGVEVNEIKKVILSGGAGKVPRLQKLVQESFPSADILVKIPPDEVLAFGAASEAFSIINTEHLNVETCLVTALARPLFCKASHCSESKCIFARGTPIHSQSSVQFSVVDCNSSICSLCIYESEAWLEEVFEEDVLAQVDIAIVPSKSSQINLDFHLKSDGSLHVTASEEVTGVSKAFIIEPGRT